MSILGGGGEIGFCVPSDGTVFETTAAGTFDAAKARCSIQIGGNFNSSSYAEWTFAGGTTTPNIGFMSYGARPAFGGSYGWIYFLDATGTARLGINTQRVDGTGSLQTLVSVFHFNGTSWVQLGSTFQVEMILQKWDVAVNASASGSVDIYVSKTNRLSVTGVDLSNLGTITKARVYSCFVNNYVSEMILSDASTVRLRGYSDHPTANGPNTDWSGGFGDVDETVYSDVDGLTSGTATNVQTVIGSTPDLDGFPVEAVLVGARGALGTTGPTGLQLAIRSGSTNYFSGTKVQTAGYGAAVGIWETDPGTSAAWVGTDAAAADYGVKSVA